jgi:hypothetical protein
MFNWFRIGRPVAVLEVFAFRDRAFAPDGDTWVCVAEQRSLERYLLQKEIVEAFTGCATYCEFVGPRYIGVWGRRNTKRFRRFLTERGAQVVVHREPPRDVRLAFLQTGGLRRRVRSIQAIKPHADRGSPSPR